MTRRQPRPAAQNMGRPKKAAGEKKKPVSVALSPAIHKALGDAAKASGRSVSNMAEQILTEALNKNNKINNKKVDSRTQKS